MTVRTTILALSALLVACGKSGEETAIVPTTEDADTDTDTDTDADTDADTDTDADADTDTDTDTDTDLPCVAEIEDLTPENGAVAVATDTVVVATFDDVVAEGDFTLAIDGVAGTTALAGDGMSATFTPDAALDTNTEYTVAWSVCSDSGETDFTTAGDPVDGGSLVNNTYGVDFAEVEFVEPPGIEAFLGDITLEYLLLQVESYDAGSSELGLVGSIGVEDGGDVYQGACYEVIPFPSVDFTANPVFRAGPSTLGFDIGYGIVVTLESMYFQAAFSDDGSELQGITINGDVDTRPLDDLAGFDVCSTLVILGISCTPCASDGATKCLYTELAADTAALVGTGVIDPSYDPSTDPVCP
jgi:hypothetical protein